MMKYMQDIGFSPDELTRKLLDLVANKEITVKSVTENDPRMALFLNVVLNKEFSIPERYEANQRGKLRIRDIPLYRFVKTNHWYHDDLAQKELRQYLESMNLIEADVLIRILKKQIPSEGVPLAVDTKVEGLPFSSFIGDEVEEEKPRRGRKKKEV